MLRTRQSTGAMMVECCVLPPSTGGLAEVRNTPGWFGRFRGGPNPKGARVGAGNAAECESVLGGRGRSR